MYAIIAALFPTNSAPAFAFFKFVQVSYINTLSHTNSGFISWCLPHVGSGAL